MKWGVIKERARADTTLCDYDHALPVNIRQRVRAVRRLLGMALQYIRLDRTKRGFHMVLRWDRDMQPAEIVAIQAILGSDPMREILNLMRATSEADGGTEELSLWNILYDRKVKPQA